MASVCRLEHSVYGSAVLCQSVFAGMDAVCTYRDTVRVIRHELPYWT